MTESCGEESCGEGMERGGGGEESCGEKRGSWRMESKGLAVVW